MTTDADIVKLKKTFATNDALAELRADMNTGFLEVGRRFDEVEGKTDALAAGIARIENSLDGISGAIQELRMENGAGAAHFARHDRQIEALALATHVALPN